MTCFKRRPLAFILALIAALSVGALVADASVTQISFTATPGDGVVRLDWETGVEMNNTGFFVNMSFQQEDGYIRISGLIPARGDDLNGATYSFTDRGLQNGFTYYYKLEAIDTDNLSEFHGPVSAVPGQPTATPSPTASISPTATQGNTPTVTPTRTATVFRSPTPSRTTSPTPGPSPTPTATPTVTETPTITPLPTFLPTLTATATFFPTPAPTATLSPTPGPLLQATRSPGGPAGLLAGVAERTGLTLGATLLLMTVLIALIGGTLFIGLAFLFLRRGAGG